MEELLQQIARLEDQVSRIEDRMELLLGCWKSKAIVTAIMALRGFKTVAAMMVVSEIGDFVRFTHLYCPEKSEFRSMSQCLKKSGRIGWKLEHAFPVGGGSYWS